MVAKPPSPRLEKDRISGSLFSSDVEDIFSESAIEFGTIKSISHRLQIIAIHFENRRKLLFVHLSSIINFNEKEHSEGIRLAFSRSKNLQGKSKFEIIDKSDYIKYAERMLSADMDEQDKKLSGLIEEIGAELPYLNQEILRHNLRAAFAATKSNIFLSVKEYGESPNLPDIAPELWENRNPDERTISPAQFIDRVYASCRQELTFKALEKLDPKLATRYRGWVGSRNPPLPYLPLPRQARSQKVKARKLGTP